MESQKGPSGELILIGELSIYAADPLLGALKDHLQASPRLDIDLSQVSACDPIGVQLLISAEITARQSGKPFKIVASSETFRNTCNALGLTDTQTEIQSFAQP